ncbi:hypothetical protein BX616_004014 [Lobosporangium transversale]|uniref:Protein SMG7 n=1 Tax=Lobosporangium transversale TaxID=64571 RepID=A0A1Y2H2S6_9FUNG|nr:hypothetical protein BCR41DRAFT_345126 [Lobosporangium transversale]KAF9916347.1 hypothetical protein BX616_004014 [Lobosporangium transversale]ORZ28324.1 hypothetical protein BCR41DRAFT_345126 [Lobosporangium transversale]|eukprot:XP_021886009.1 hypothetical protein BCR41DRAFT_345126 [Lobosporangium transversale]
MTEDPQTIWLECYKSTQEQERNLKELLHQKGATGVTLARDRLREEYERLILSNVVLAQSKEIESALWKNVFYIVIDGYRRKLATLGRPEINSNEQQGSKVDNRRNRDSGRSRPHGTKGNKTPVPSIEYRKVSTKFRAFLQEATGFYHRLIQNLASCYDLNESGSSTQSFPISDKRPLLEVTDTARQCAISSCHKCYIFLGDLARYRQTYSESPKKNWSAARDYYNEARNMLPSSGNPYNQLAVIATFAPNNFLALYFYYRSLAVRLPFNTARNNIKVLIQKMTMDPDNGRKFVREEKPNDRQAANTKDSSQLDDFLSKFILLHGALFMNSLDKFDSGLMGDTLEQLILDRHIDPDLMLKIQIINMSSLYTKCYIPDESQTATPQQQIESERQALELILGMFATILRYSVKELGHHRNGDQKNIGRPADFLPSNVHRSMPTLRLTLKWMQVNIHHVKRLSDGNSDENKRRFQLDIILNHLARFLTLLGQVHPYTEDTIFCRDVLKEDAELQGFAALKRAIDERPLSIIPPSRISPKAEMQIRIADMFQDALSLSKIDWLGFYARLTEMEGGKQGLRFSSECEEDVDSSVSAMYLAQEEGSLKSVSQSQSLEEQDDGDVTDYERNAEDEDLNPFHVSKVKRNDHISTPPVSTNVVKQDIHRDQYASQRQTVAALLSDDDNDLSLIVGNDDDDDDDDDDEEEEVVLFKGRSNAAIGKPTPRPAHLKTATGVIGAGRRGSISPTRSNQSSPGMDVNGPSKFSSVRPSPTIDSPFGGFEFDMADDWRHSISSLRSSPTSNMSSSTWGGLSINSLGNGMISPTVYEPKDANIITGFTSIPSRGPPGVASFPTCPPSINPSGFFDEESFYQHQQQYFRPGPYARPRNQYQTHALPQHQQDRSFIRGEHGTTQNMRGSDWR